MGRRNPFIRVRRYDQRPQHLWSWAEEHDEHGIIFCDATNPLYGRERRRQS